MEGEEPNYDCTECRVKDVGCNYVVGKELVCFIRLKHPLYYWVRSCNDYGGGQCSVKQHVQEILIIIESKTVCHPRTVMIHL